MTLKLVSELKGSSAVRIGVVGYSSGEFDKKKAKKLVYDALDSLCKTYDGKVEIVSGLTNIGIPAIAYQYAKEHDLPTVGIACKKAEEYDCFPCDHKIILGDNWGDESTFFLSFINCMVRVGGGDQSHDEVQQFKKMHGGKNIKEYELARTK